MRRSIALFLFTLGSSVAFQVRPLSFQVSRGYGGAIWAKTAKTRSDENKRRSRVSDPDGPTPELVQEAIEEIEPDDIEELRDIRNANELPTPIPYQPWRRGDTAGCEAPIAAEWRVEAEDIIKKAVKIVGGQVLDVTWYLTSVVVTLDEEIMPSDMLKDYGPVINIVPKTSPIFSDPDDPNPEDIWDDDDDVLYQRQSEEEREASANRRNMMYAAKDQDDPEDEPHISDQVDGDEIPLYMNEETRSDVVLKEAGDLLQRYDEDEKPIDVETIRIDSAALSILAQAILDALEEREEDLQILSRHELILTSPGASDVLETQRQFDAYRGFDVIVETQDPWESNRTLKGKLVSRNAMDVIINKKGRMVTIPLNFVKCVRLPPAKREKGVPRDAPF